MRIVAAMDKFKGTLAAAEASRAVAEGFEAAIPGVAVDVLPVADGGEGTTAAVQAALGGEMREVEVPNAVGSALVSAPVLFVSRQGRNVAVMEMSASAGLELLRKSERDPFKASTIGVGRMLLFAVEQGADEIIIGIGGSATNDGGVGVASAFGYVFEDRSGMVIRELPLQLPEAVTLRRPKGFDAPVVTVACDVTNPLLGPNGATYVYAPQKGGSPEDLFSLEERMEHLADLATASLGCDYRGTPGAGAAGGLGFGLLTFLDATLRPGFPLLAGLLGLDARIARADAVITGEGSLDAQTLNGKTPMGVAEIARRHGKPVIAIGGKVDRDALADMFDGVWGLVDATTSSERAMSAARRVLADRAQEACAMAEAAVSELALGNHCDFLIFSELRRNEVLARGVRDGESKHDFVDFHARMAQ